MTELSGYVFSPLQEGEITLYRGSGDGLDPILLVAPAGEDAARKSRKRLEHEYALRSALDPDWAARPAALVPRDGRLMLVLEDPGGEPLDRLLGRKLEVGQFLRIALPLAAALRRVHQRGLIHKDVKPGNVLVDLARGAAWLTGFGIASRLPREHRAPEPPEVIAGTLAYMAPEQTGRMNRSIDSRSDLYSLGVTFYEMLTGALPFAAADPIEWIHCHIARQPVPPGERVMGVPAQLSAMVMKLLAKTAEERYQTAAGVEADLRRCLAAWESFGRIDPFPLATQDASDRLMIPERLYGREREIDILVAAFDRVVTHGTTELVLVSGYAGIGKSSLVNELHKVLVPPRGLFAAGKFDQYKQAIPYATLVQAFHSLVRDLLNKKDAELDGWRHALLEALGPNGQLMVNLIPELALIIGEQPAVPDLPPQDAQSRFQLVLRHFLGVFAGPEHPIALFLDDLQWLDAATLELLERLITEWDVPHVLLVGAYRDNELSPSHPLLRTLAAIRNAGGRVQEIVLGPLRPDDVGRLVADALHTERGRVQPLAELVIEKTAGNPFFANQFIAALAEERLLAFDPDAGAWHWDINRIRAKGITDNVADLMAGKLIRLPEAARDVMKQLACLGNSAQTATLSMVLGKSEEEIHAALCDAVRAGLVRHQGGAYAFLHDRVQEAAYALIPDGERVTAHLRIGRVLASRTASTALEEKIFEIVSQLDRGASLIETPDERARVAELNLIAGKRAKASTAYASALTYLATGSGLLAGDGWERQPRLIFELELNRAECEFLTGDFAVAEERLSILSLRAENLVDQAAVTWLRVTLYTTLGRFDYAIDTGLEFLRSTGILWSPHPTNNEVRLEYERIWQQLGDRSIESLLDLPLMSNKVGRATLEVLTALHGPALFIDQHLQCLIVTRMVNLSLLHGNSDASCYAYVRLGMILGPHFGEYRLGFRFGQLGAELVEKRRLHRFEARVYMSFGNGVNAWTRHILTGRALLRRAFDAATRNGDVTYASYGFNNLVTNMIARGDPLSEVQREAENGLEFARKARFGLVVDLITAQLNLVRALRGMAADFSYGLLGERQFEQHLEQSPGLKVAACWYWIRKLQSHFLSGAYSSAVAAAARAEVLLWTSSGHFETAEYHFYAALALAAQYDMVSAEEQIKYSEALVIHHRQLALWTKNCPENFANRATLVAAEIARIEGRELDGERLYEDAIRSARDHGFIQNEGLGHELAARFYAGRGFETIANAYLTNARNCFIRWGALGKVAQLDQSHPRIGQHALPTLATTIEAPVEQLDLATMINMSQAVSGEIVLEKLIEILMVVAVEHAAAERGVLLLPHGNDQRIEAEATTEGDTVKVRLLGTLATPSEVPDSILRYVIRTQESVILDDASAQSPFSADEYIRQKHARSVLCLPLVKQTELVGVLYLENNLASQAFTPARIAVLKLLSSQAAIALQNARLYAELIQENRGRQKAEEALRASEERWRNLFENASVGIAMAGSHGRFVAANPAYQKMVGYSEAELQRLSPADISHEDDRHITARIIKAHVQGQLDVQRYEKRYRRKDGSVIWVDISAFLIPVAGSAPVLCGVAVDITDRKRAEYLIKQVFDTSPDAVSIIGKDYRYLRANPVYERNFQIPAEKFVGMHAADVLGTENFEQTVKPNLDRCFAGEEVHYAWWIATPSGRRYLAVSYSPLRPYSERVEAALVIVRDLTEHLQASESLQQARTELARVARLTTMGELVASIAHEINQPLAAIAITGSACLLWLNRDKPDLDEARRSVSRIVRDASRAGDVIRGLRTLAMKSGPQLSKLDIDDAIQEVLALTRSDLQRNGVVVYTDLAALGCVVLGDRVQLQQVLLNLIMNAAEAMSAVTDRPKMLTIISRPVEAGVLVAVEDTGPGLDPATADRLFESFFTTKPNGIGMGLSICRSIIEAHGGRLWAAPNEPHGAIFQFRLPADGREAP